MSFLTLSTVSGNLLYSDSPEYITESGSGYTVNADIPACQKTRVFLYHMNNIPGKNAVIGLAAKSKAANNPGFIHIERGNYYVDNYMNPYNNTNLGKATALKQYLNGIGENKFVSSNGLIRVSQVGAPNAFFNMLLDITPSVNITIRAFISNKTNMTLADVFSLKPASPTNGPAGMFNYIGVKGGTIRPKNSYHIMQYPSQNGFEFGSGTGPIKHIDGNFGIPYSIACYQNTNYITLYVKSGLSETKPIFHCFGDGNKTNAWQVAALTQIKQDSNYKYYSLTIDMRYFVVKNELKNINLCLPGGSYGRADIWAQ